MTAVLDAGGADYTIIAHEENYSSAQDGAGSGLGTLAEMAPAFILSTEAGYLSAVIRGDTRLSYKKIKQKLGLKNISLAAPDMVRQVTGSGIPNHTLRISPGAVIAITQARVFDFTELKNSIITFK